MISGRGNPVNFREGEMGKQTTVCSWDMPIVDERWGVSYTHTIRIGRVFYGANWKTNAEQVFRWIEVPFMAGDATPAWQGEIIEKKMGMVKVRLTKHLADLEIDWKLMRHEEGSENG